MSGTDKYYRTNSSSTAFTGETTTNTDTANIWGYYSYVLYEATFTAVSATYTIYYYNENTLLNTLTQSSNGTSTRIYRMIFTDVDGSDEGTFLGKQLGNTYTFTNNTFTLKTYSLTGYNLSWNTASTLLGTTYNLNATYTVSNLVNNLYLNKTAISYALTWNLNNGTGGTNRPSSINYNASLTFPTVAQSPTRTGYTFAGWNDGTTTYNAGSSINPYTSTSGKNFTAQWTAISYALTWNLNNGTGGTNRPSSINYNASLTFPTVAQSPTRTGYTFAGWNDGTTTYNAGSSINPYTSTSGKNFTAQWTALTYSVSYVKDGGTTSSDPILATYNASFTLPSISKTNHTFNGWYTTSTFTDTQYTTTAFTWNLTANTTFYAKFTINNFTLTYNPNGKGTGKEISVTAATSTTTPILKAVGYTFGGWYTDINTTTPIGGVSTTYTMPSANTTLYAKWTDNTQIKISNLQDTYGNIENSTISIKEYQSILGITASSKTSFNNNLKGKGPAPP